MARTDARHRYRVVIVVGAEVIARAERSTGPGENHDPYGVIHRDGGEQFDQIAFESLGHGVESGRTIKGDRHDARRAAINSETRVGVDLFFGAGGCSVGCHNLIMAYNSTGLTVHDADAHIMETPTWLRDYADPAIRDHAEVLTYPGGNELQQAVELSENVRDLESAFDRLTQRHRSEEYRAVEEAELMSRKNFAATGSYLAEDRPRALDMLGFASQLVFNTFHNARLRTWEHSGDLDLAIGVAAAHNRGMLDFCSVDSRLLPTLYVPLADIDRAGGLATTAIKQGAGALLIASSCPPTHSPSHIGLDPVWAAAAEAGVPIVFHVGGTGELLDRNYFNNGLPTPPDFHGGEENFRSVDYMAIPVQPAQTLATMVFDGVFERFPDLMVGVIEQGAIWVPSWMRQMESAFDAFARHEDRLQKLSMRPSDYVRRQMRFTPYPTEDVGWIISQAGAEIPLFSSDFPHVEGGRRPIERFERSIANCSDADRQAFYHDNFEDLMGGRLGSILAASHAA